MPDLLLETFVRHVKLFQHNSKEGSRDGGAMAQCFEGRTLDLELSEIENRRAEVEH